MTSAAGFHEVTVPSTEQLMMASLDDATNAANRRISASDFKASLWSWNITAMP